MPEPDPFVNMNRGMIVFPDVQDHGRDAHLQQIADNGARDRGGQTAPAAIGTSMNVAERGDAHLTRHDVRAAKGDKPLTLPNPVVDPVLQHRWQEERRWLIVEEKLDRVEVLGANSRRSIRIIARSSIAS